MKKFIYVFATILLFISCSEDKKPLTKISENDIKGTWNLTNLYSENGKISTTVEGITLNGSLKITSEEYNNPTTTFTTNPNEVYDNGSIKLKTSINIMGQNFEESEVVDADSNIKGQWSLSDNRLSLFSSFSSLTDKYEAEVIEFDENTLKLKVNLSQDTTVSEEMAIDSPVPFEKLKVNVVVYIVYSR